MHNKFIKQSILGLSVLALASAAALAQPKAEPRKPLSPVTEEMLRNPPAADWLMFRRTYDAWGYSPLDRINKGNVKNLRVAWTWALTTGATEITPIVHDGAMVMPTRPSRLLSAGSSAQSAESAALRPSWFNALNLYQSVALSCERRGVGSSPASSSQSVDRLRIRGTVLSCPRIHGLASRRGWRWPQRSSGGFPLRLG